MHVVVRLVVEHVEQQRQLAFVLPSSRGRTINESVTFTRRAARPAATRERQAPASRARRFASCYLIFLFFSYLIISI